MKMKRGYTDAIIIIAYIVTVCIVMACLGGCKVRKVDEGIYRVKSGGRWYVTDTPKEIKEIK